MERALLRLGLDAVRGIAAVTCLDRTMVRSNGCLVDMKVLVQHSLVTAAAAESLARIQRRSLAPAAFIAGLLHNLGVAVQIHLDTPGINAMIAARQTDATRDIRLLELECAAVGHEECVAVMFEAWQLPDSLVAAARHRHDPMEAPEAHRELASLVNLGANLALACGSTFMLEPAAVECNALAMTQAGIGEVDLNGVAAALPEHLAELRRALLDA